MWREVCFRGVVCEVITLKFWSPYKPLPGCIIRWDYPLVIDAISGAIRDSETSSHSWSLAGDIFGINNPHMVSSDMAFMAYWSHVLRGLSKEKVKFLQLIPGIYLFVTKDIIMPLTILKVCLLVSILAFFFLFLKSRSQITL